MLSASFANNRNTIFGTRLTCHYLVVKTFLTFELNPKLRLQPNKSISVHSHGAALVTLASYFCYATNSFKIIMGVSSFSFYVHIYNFSEDLVSRVMTYLNDKHKGWNNQDTIWCFHYEPKFQSSLSSLKSETFRKSNPQRSLHTFFSPRHTSLHLNKFLVTHFFQNTSQKASPDNTIILSNTSFAPDIPFLFVFFNVQLEDHSFNLYSCKLHNFSQWNVHQIYRNKTLQ